MKYYVDYNGGESRYDNRAIDYMLVEFDEDDEGEFEVEELYAEVLWDDFLESEECHPYIEKAFTALKKEGEIEGDIEDIWFDEEKMDAVSARVVTILDNLDGRDVWSEFSYPRLKAEILRQAEENGIPKDVLEFPGLD